MAEDVVDLLEAVEVERQQCERLAVATACQRCLMQAVLQQDAVGQFGQRIVIGQIRHALVGAAPLAPHFGFTQLALDGGRQTGEIALHDVVVRPASSPRLPRVRQSCPTRR